MPVLLFHPAQLHLTIHVDLLYYSRPTLISDINERIRIHASRCNIFHDASQVAVLHLVVSRHACMYSFLHVGYSTFNTAEKRYISMFRP
jgi:hypothetical protein